MRLLIDILGVHAIHHDRGFSRYALSLVLALLRQGSSHDIRLLINGDCPQVVDEIRRLVGGLLPSERLRVLQTSDSLHVASNTNTDRRQYAQLQRNAVIVEFDPDVVLITSFFEGQGGVEVVSVDQDGPPTVVVLYDLIPLIYPDLYLTNPVARQWYQVCLQELRKAKLLLSISQHTRSEAIECLQWPADRVVNISAACEDSFEPTNVPVALRHTWAEKYGLIYPFLMYTGGVDKRQNIERLIRAYSQLPAFTRSAHQLVIVSAIGSEDRARLQQEAAQMGLQHYELIITGHVPEHELVALYNACKAFVYPSLHEDFGLPVLEAMQCGKAVIASNSTSLPEIVGLPEALFDPLNENDIRDRIQWVLSDDAARIRLEQHSRTQSQKFSWDATAGTTITALENFLSQPAQPASVAKPRLACIAPLPPANSSVSDDAIQLIKALIVHYEVEVVVEQDAVRDAWVVEHCSIRSMEWFLHHHPQFDRVLYHFGNSEFYDQMLHLVRRVPGVVVLHDFYLSSLQSHHLQREDQASWRRMLYANHGYPALLADQLPSDREQTIFRYPCNIEVLQHATGIIVHTDFSRKLASHWHGRQSVEDWCVIPLMRESQTVTHVAWQNARMDLGLPLDAFVVCNFGLAGELKTNLDLLDAFVSSSLADASNCMLVFLEANDTGPYGKTLQRRIEQSGLGQRIRIKGCADAHEHQKYLMAADIGIQLGAHSRGEASADVLDCMAFGLPTIVNSSGSNGDLDPAAVWMLPAPFSVHDLFLALEALWKKPDKRKQIGRAARQLVATRHAPERCTQQYVDAIEHFHAHAVHSLPGLMHASLQHNLNTADRMAAATVLSRNYPPRPRHRQLLVDISELVHHDARTGIQRVTRAVLNEWLRRELNGWRIEPVWANQETPGYRYARQYTNRMLGLSEDWAEDERVEAWAGDIFLGLDLQPKTVPAQRDTLRQWHRLGVKVGFVVYDLLPVQYPNFFLPNAAQEFTPWLETVAEFDAAYCISHTTRDALQLWLQQQPDRPQPALHWFHLGADVEQSMPTQGLPENARQLLDQLEHTPGFLMVGTLEPRKGHAQVLDAFEHLWHGGHALHLIIVGKQGWMVDELAQRLANHPEQASQLHWLQGVSDEYLSRLYESSAALIAASYDEGYGLPLIEAARHGCPVLARDISVFREVAEDNAQYFSAQTGPELAQALLTWLELKAQGREPSSRNMHTLTWRKSASNLLKLVCMDKPHHH